MSQRQKFIDEANIRQTATSTPIVFLDFDDVLCVHREHNSTQVLEAFRNTTLDDVPNLWENIFHYSARTNLRALHDEFSPRYVISSTWASFLDQAQISETLRRTGIEFVAEYMHTHWRTPREKGSNRYTEIKHWIDAHSLDSSVSYVILDDKLSGESIPGSQIEERAVLCDAWVGFTHPKLRSAQKILRDQLR